MNKWSWLDCHTGTGAHTHTRTLTYAHRGAHRGATCDVDPLYMCGTKWSRDPEHKKERLTFKNRLGLLFIPSAPRRTMEVSIFCVIENFISLFCHICSGPLQQQPREATEWHVTSSYLSGRPNTPTQTYFLGTESFYLSGGPSVTLQTS